MKMIQGVFIIWLTLSLGGMLADAGHKARATAQLDDATIEQMQNAEDEEDMRGEYGQPAFSGVDDEYRHGHWCVDSRSF